MKKILGMLFLTLTISCNQFGNSYPKYVSISESYKPIEYCNSKEIDDLNDLPIKTQEFIKSHLIQKLGTHYFNELKVTNVEVFSDIVLEHFESLNDLVGKDNVTGNCSEDYDYPVYTITYNFDLKELGIQKIGLNLILDKNNKIIKDIEHEKDEFENIKYSIDSVQSQLKQQNISHQNLKIYLGFDDESKTFTWNTYTVISEGSIAGPSCFPEYKYHFKMDSKTGKITKISNENRGLFN
ncbi:hypothetical protein [Ulvibacterium marinum]|uniref:hypothetical protein n=1 Tax=Ulvibacterium marinum TaxID=2419782 RepID=UPI0024950FF7|nr:hypothetical protein [Ulvibacterium marinum]